MSYPSHTIPSSSASVSVFIGLGSNLPSAFGSPQATLLAAMEKLAAWSRAPALKSSLWTSEPVDCPPGSPLFVNAVVGIAPAPDETPRGLLARLLALESEFGRRRGEQVNAPRNLDLDLICFGDQRSADAVLTLPHPAAHRRGFVLLPLAEIAPALRLPGQQRTIGELAAALAPGEPLVAKIVN